MLDLTRVILSEMKSDLEPVVLDEAKHEILHQSLLAGKARERLGWKPAFTLEQGLDRTIGWYRELLRG